MAVLTIARITLREASRRKLLLAVAILTLVVAVLSGWAFHKLLALPCGTSDNPHPCPPYEIRLVAATLLILLLFMFSFVLALGAAFVAAPSISGDIESGVMLAVLPRPIRRAEYQRLGYGKETKREREGEGLCLPARRLSPIFAFCAVR